MSTPDAFMSSPAALTSSPGLPSLQELLARNSKRQVLTSGTKAAPLLRKASTSLASAGTQLRSGCTNDASASIVPRVGQDADASVKKAPQPKKSSRPKTKPAPRQRKKTAPEPEAPCSPLLKDQPWRKFKSPSKSPGRKNLDGASESRAAPLPPSSLGDGVKSHFFQTPEAPTRGKTEAPKRKVQDEPLNLEQAMSRRLSWTPPAETAYVVLDSKDGPTHMEDLNASREEHGKTTVAFEDVVASYRCSEELQQSTLVISDGSSTKSNKRKLAHLAPTTENDVPDSKAEKPAKKKRVRAKPKTVTALATAAYRAPTQLDDSSLQGVVAQASDVKTSRKPQPRKRATKPRKKKQAEPPKPALLSPEAALKIAAQQDFVFGTSSQLVREQSPSLLRNLQAPIRESNQFNDFELETPINSDAIEPSEQRQTLWDAGARNEDGDLFDFRLCSIQDGSPGQLQASNESDPFGYMRCDDKVGLLSHTAAINNKDCDDLLPPIPKLSVAPKYSPPRETSNVSDDMKLANDVTAMNTNVIPSQRKEPCIPAKEDAGGILEMAEPTPSVATDRGPTGSTYDFLSDAQLAKQIADYGFKPIKKRAAMIALLEQCRPGRGATGQGVRFASSIAKKAPKEAPRAKSGTTETRKSKTKEKELKTSKSTEKESEPSKTQTKKTKKNADSDDEGMMQEPPPSAQPIVTPVKRRSSRASPESSAPETMEKKRRPGRPRKSSVASDKVVLEQEISADAGVKKRRDRPKKEATPSPSLEMEGASSTPKRKSKKWAMIEVQDDEFDDMIDLEFDEHEDSSDSSRSSRSSMRSKSTTSSKRSRSRSSQDSRRSRSRSLDLSLTFDDDDDAALSLETSPTEQQASLFASMTEAVKTAPRTTNAAKPSWHDKILLYDPIVIEDLTNWLNKGQLKRVGCKEKVSAADVKRWCESKSICCLWKVNWRGQERKRY